MTGNKMGMALSLGLAMLLPGVAHAQTMRFTPDDYEQIKQLTARYVYAIDNCIDHGNAYADLYTADGTFGVSIAWDNPGIVWAAGHDALAKSGGSCGPDGLPKQPSWPTYGVHHIVTSQIILPTADGGAIGKSTLLAIGVGHNPNNIEYQGGYQDVYVKMPAGWRIRSRRHVWLDQEYSIQAKSMGRTKEMGAARN